MPNGYDYSKEYGPHDYGHGGHSTSDCRHGCGCVMGRFFSHGPIGIDPVSGECPCNPKDGKLLGGSADHEVVVTRRIGDLEEALREASAELKKLQKIKNTPKARMTEMIEALEEELREKNELLVRVKGLVTLLIEKTATR